MGTGKPVPMSKDICYLFHVGVWKRNNPNIDIRRDFPPSLAKIIRSKQIMKVVSAPENDAKWLFEDFGITMTGFVDIQAFAIQLGENKTGLDSLASKFIQNWTPKNKFMYKSAWNSTLTKEMIEYAAYDAYASYHIFNKMFPNLFKQKYINMSQSHNLPQLEA